MKRSQVGMIIPVVFVKLECVMNVIVTIALVGLMDMIGVKHD